MSAKRWGPSNSVLQISQPGDFCHFLCLLVGKIFINDIFYQIIAGFLWDKGCRFKSCCQRAAEAAEFLHEYVILVTSPNEPSVPHEVVAVTA